MIALSSALINVHCTQPSCLTWLTFSKFCKRSSAFTRAAASLFNCSFSGLTTLAISSWTIASTSLRSCVEVLEMLVPQKLLAGVRGGFSSPPSYIFTPDNLLPLLIPLIREAAECPPGEPGGWLPPHLHREQRLPQLDAAVDLDALLLSARRPAFDREGWESLRRLPIVFLRAGCDCARLRGCASWPSTTVSMSIMSALRPGF